jgi:chemotaxis protein MotB
MHNKKVPHEEHADETWLLPYSDMMTLLLALFIVMFAMSKTDNEKMKAMSEQFSIVFSGGAGIMEKDGNSVIEMFDNKTDVGNSEKNSNDITISSTKSNETIEDEKMKEIKEKIEKEIDEEGYANKVKLVLDGEGLEISIQDVVLFNIGDAEIKKDVYPLLLHVTGIIKGLDNSIKVVGHTDNVPIHNAKFRSNWDLSSFRAINVMNFMMEQGKMSPKKFSIQAYGEFKPKYDNSTEEGRAKNRRVEIYIVRNYPLDEKKKTNDKVKTNDEKKTSSEIKSN